MKPQYLKSLWETLKNLGQFPEYSDYEEYRQAKWGTEETPKNKFQMWLDELPENEKKDFLYVFGDN